jgi:CheY-like chemotaxis protein
MSVILLVDDNDDIRKIFSIFLSRKGHTIHAVPGGRESIELLSTVTPDIILLDIMMPDMDGWETLCAIKMNQTTQAIPVTMCSGKLPDVDEIDRYGRYIEDYLVKPQELSKLSNILVSITERYIKHRAEIESLKNEILDGYLVNEFYDCLKTLSILEKFSRFFTADRQKTESVIQRYRARIQEIRESLGHPALAAAMDLQPGMAGMHDDPVKCNSLPGESPTMDVTSDRRDAAESDIRKISADNWVCTGEHRDCNKNKVSPQVSHERGGISNPDRSFCAVPHTTREED